MRRTWAERVGTGLDLSVATEIIAPRVLKPSGKLKPVVDIAVQSTEPAYVASDEDLDPFFTIPVTVPEEA